MSQLKSFLAGTGLAAVCLFPLALVAGFAIIVALIQEADARSARQIKALMWQVKPGVTECAHESNTLNCKVSKRGKVKTLVLSAARE